MMQKTNGFCCLAAIPQVAVDFTASNRSARARALCCVCVCKTGSCVHCCGVAVAWLSDPTDPESLHYISSKPNVYQRALQSVASSLRAANATAVGRAGVGHGGAG